MLQWYHYLWNKCDEAVLIGKTNENTWDAFCYSRHGSAMWYKCQVHECTRLHWLYKVTKAVCDDECHLHSSAWTLRVTTFWWVQAISRCAHNTICVPIMLYALGLKQTLYAYDYAMSIPTNKTKRYERKRDVMNIQINEYAASIQ